MIRFGVKNLRRLKAVDPVSIKPITVLVGRNSSGKSTFLRSFPLLRQSIATRSSSPILWYGDLVDFGSFQEVVSDKELNETIVFSFKIDEVRVASQGYDYEFGFYAGSSIRSVANISLDAFVSGYQNKTRLSGFRLSYENGHVTYEVDLNEVGGLSRLSLNGKRVEALFDQANVTFSTGSLFPDVHIRPIDQLRSPPHRGLFNPYRNPLHQPLIGVLRPHLDKRMREEVVERLAFELLSIGEYSDLELERLQSRTTVRSFAKLIEDVRGRNKKGIRDDVRTIITVNRFAEAVSSTFAQLRGMMSGILYIGPARARSERYYRYQELAVSEIDPDGKNFPMFLNSLSERLRRNFSDWVQERFGYGVSVSQLEGHISINLTLGGSKTNIVDTGFGVSQVLPVLGQIWWASVGSTLRPMIGQNSETRILAIEQPELHLHPAHQALLADAIVSERGRFKSGTSQNDLSFLVESHSEAFVNRLGELIATNKIDANDVHILVFEGDFEDERRTNVRVAEFSSDGSLVNWPFGFFQPVPHYDF